MPLGTFDVLINLAAVPEGRLRMRDLADALQETLEQVRIPENLALAVQLRSEEKHYWRRRAPQDIEGTHRALAALHNRVHSAPVDPAWAATIVGRLAQYHQHFEALVAIDGEVTVLTEAMRETMHQVSPLVQGIKAANRAAMRARAKAISHAATHRAAGDLEIHRRQRAGHVKRKAVPLRQYREAVGADLVCHVAVRGDAVGAHDHGIDFPAAHEVARRTVRDERDGYAVLR